MAKDDTSSSDSNSMTWSSLEVLSESLLRISLAGLGGALVGLSFRHSRRHNPFPSTTAFAYDNAPYTFAIRFTAFVGILEFHRLLSPSNMIKSFVDQRMLTLPHVPTPTKDIQPDDVRFNTILDYSMGGAVAGAIFSRIPMKNYETSVVSVQPVIEQHEKTRIKQKRLIGKGRILTLPSKSSIMTVPITTPTSFISNEGLHKVNSFRFTQAMMRGAVPGLVLGCMAGLLQYALDELLVSVQKMEEQQRAFTQSQDVSHETDKDIDVKSMTIDELKREIELLKGHRNE